MEADALYNAVAESTVKEIQKLNELISKKNNAATGTGERFYGSKIEKQRNTCIQQIAKMNEIDADKTEVFLQELFKEPTVEEDQEKE
jgi:hypothetical protein